MRIGRTSFTQGQLNPPFASDERAPRTPQLTWVSDSSSHWASVRWRGWWFQVYRPRYFSRSLSEPTATGRTICLLRRYHRDEVASTHTVYEAGARSAFQIYRCRTCGRRTATKL